MVREAKGLLDVGDGSAFGLATVELVEERLGGGGRAGGVFLEGPLLKSPSPSGVVAVLLVLLAVRGGAGRAGGFLSLSDSTGGG